MIFCRVLGKPASRPMCTSNAFYELSFSKKRQLMNVSPNSWGGEGGEGKKTLLGQLHVPRMYVCMVTHIERVWINRIRLPILHVVS